MTEMFEDYVEYRGRVLLQKGTTLVRGQGRCKVPSTSFGAYFSEQRPWMVQHNSAVDWQVQTLATNVPPQLSCRGYAAGLVVNVVDKA